MSLLPMIFSNWWEGLDEPHHVRDQHFGMGLHPEHLITDIFEPRPMHHHHRVTRGPHGHYYRPWWIDQHRRKNDSGLSTVKSAKDNFQVVLDVQQFAPEEINVKVSHLGAKPFFFKSFCFKSRIVGITERFQRIIPSVTVIH